MDVALWRYGWLSTRHTENYMLVLIKHHPTKETRAENSNWTRKESKIGFGAVIVHDGMLWCYTRYSREIATSNCWHCSPFDSFVLLCLLRCQLFQMESCYHLIATTIYCVRVIIIIMDGELFRYVSSFIAMVRTWNKAKKKKTHRKSHIDRPIDFGQSLSSSEQLQQEFFSYKGENKNRRKKSTTASRNKRKRNKLWLCKGSHITIKMISYMLLKIIMFNILIHNGNGNGSGNSNSINETK